MSYDNPPPPPPPQYGAPTYGAVPGTNRKAIWSLVTGILGLVCCPIVFSIAALVLSNQAKKEIRATGASGEGMATAGLVLGIIGIVLGVVQIILLATGHSLYDFNTT